MKSNKFNLFALTYYWSKFFKKLRGEAIINSKIDRTSKIESGSLVVNSNMAKHSFCGYDCEILNTNIGSFCSIANGVIIGGGAHPIDWVSTSPVFYFGRDSVKAKFTNYKRTSPLVTIIGNDVWIGQNAILKQGIVVGTGAIIGMGSVVTKNVEPFTIVAGNPAKLIRKRFDDLLITELLESKWWDIDEKTLKSLASFIKTPNIFVEKLKSINK